MRRSLQTILNKMYHDKYDLELVDQIVESLEDSISKKWIEEYCEKAIECYTKDGNEDAVKIWNEYVIPVIKVMVIHWERENGKAD